MWFGVLMLPDIGKAFPIILQKVETGLIQMYNEFF